MAANSFFNDAKFRLKSLSLDVYNESTSTKLWVLYVIAFVMTVWLVAQSAVAIQEVKDIEDAPTRELLESQSKFQFSIATAVISALALLTIIVLFILTMVGRQTVQSRAYRNALSAIQEKARLEKLAAQL